MKPNCFIIYLVLGLIYSRITFEDSKCKIINIRNLSGIHLNFCSPCLNEIIIIEGGLNNSQNSYEDIYHFDYRNYYHESTVDLSYELS